MDPAAITEHIRALHSAADIDRVAIIADALLDVLRGFSGTEDDETYLWACLLAVSLKTSARTADWDNHTRTLVAGGLVHLLLSSPTMEHAREMVGRGRP